MEPAIMEVEANASEIPPLPIQATMDISAKADDDTPEEITTEQPPISKSQLKKLRRAQKQADSRVEWKLQKKVKDKERKAKKRQEKAQREAEEKMEVSSIASSTKRKAEDGGEGEGGVEAEAGAEGRNKKQKTVHQVLEPIGLVIDCGFDELMTDKEIISLCAQVTRCYSANRAAKNQVSLQISSLNGRLKGRYESVLKNQHLKWKNVKFLNTEYEVTEQDMAGDLVYLTADSDDTIEQLEDGKKYIIGGIVDRNRHKNLCLEKANKQGIKTAKLPIGEYIRMSSRSVLTTNQVVEIMLKWLECRDWKEAFMEIIPQRKMPKALVARKEGEGEGEDDDSIENGVENGTSADYCNEATEPDVLPQPSTPEKALISHKPKEPGETEAVEDRAIAAETSAAISRDTRDMEEQEEEQDKEETKQEGTGKGGKGEGEEVKKVQKEESKQESKKYTIREENLEDHQRLDQEGLSKAVN